MKKALIVLCLAGLFLTSCSLESKSLNTPKPSDVESSNAVSIVNPPYKEIWGATLYEITGGLTNKQVKAIDKKGKKVPLETFVNAKYHIADVSETINFDKKNTISFYNGKGKKLFSLTALYEGDTLSYIKYDDVLYKRRDESSYIYYQLLQLTGDILSECNPKNDEEVQSKATMYEYHYIYIPIDKPDEIKNKINTTWYDDRGKEVLTITDCGNNIVCINGCYYRIEKDPIEDIPVSPD